ncbi:MAG: bifunctional riboflavin kinase/FAD synthetase [Balneolaceae bacterium]|nr:MAG: bifunctional riboflavin kinase/FAD synthetase [Balneolaceae bacterium]
MIWLDEIERDENTVLTVGTFDGVHAGHRALIHQVLRRAQQRKARSVIVTFDPHPRDIINPGTAGIRMLTSARERAEILTDLGVELVVVIPFDRDFSLLTSEQFVRDVIWKKIGVSEFVIGYDHQFGRDRQGTIETVERLGLELGFTSRVISRQEIEEKTVSSTAIRKAIMNMGNMQLAASFLQRNYILNGTVIHGDKRGASIGYPTANLQPHHPSKVIPLNGVYAVWARINGEYFPAMMNIGDRPTFEQSGYSLEVHIFDFSQNLYGREIQVQFAGRIRDEMKFEGVEALVNQLERDRIDSLEILNKIRPDIAKQVE